MTRQAATLRLRLVAAEHVERIGQRMEARRLELGLTRRDIAGRVGGKTNENSVYRWERGKHEPEAETLQLLVTALEVDDVSYFMSPEPELGTPDLMAALPSGREVDQLTRIERKLDRLLKHFAVAELEVPPDDLGQIAQDSAPTSPRSPRAGSPRGKDARQDSGAG